MKIGIFDSGVGGLIIAKAIRKVMPEYDYVYFVDTKRVPYGNRSHETVLEFTTEGVDYLFNKENCAIVILACNTASAWSLRQIQQNYLPKNFPDRKVLGVLIPAAEEAGVFSRIGLIGTEGTVSSGTFPVEIKKINKNAKVFQNPAPMLVPLAEAGEKEKANKFIEEYLEIFSGKYLDALVLGCTHYPFFKVKIKKEIDKISKKDVRIISQDDILPKKLKEYLKKHQEISKKLSKNGTAKVLVTDVTKHIILLVKKWFGRESRPILIKL